MPISIEAALVVLAITIIMTAVTVLKLVPDMITQREKERDQEYQNQLKEREKERKKELTELRMEFEQNKATMAMFNATSENLSEMTAALIASQSRAEESNRILNDNTNAVGGYSEALADMAERLGILLNTGSKPLQEAVDTLRDLKEHGTRPAQHIDERLDEVYSLLQDVDNQVSADGHLIQAIREVHVRLQELDEMAREKMKLLEKRKTGPIPLIKSEGENL